MKSLCKVFLSPSHLNTGASRGSWAAALGLAGLILAGSANAQQLCDPCEATISYQAGPASLTLTDWMVPDDTNEIVVVAGPRHGAWTMSKSTGDWVGEYAPTVDFVSSGLDQISLWIGTLSNVDEGLRTLILHDSNGVSVHSYETEFDGSSNYLEETEGAALVQNGYLEAVVSGSSDAILRPNIPPNTDIASSTQHVTSTGGPDPMDPPDPDGDFQEMAIFVTKILKLAGVLSIEARFTPVSPSGWQVETRAVVDDSSFACAECATEWFETPDSVNKNLRAWVGPDTHLDGSSSGWSLFYTVEDAATGAVIPGGAFAVTLPAPNEFFPKIGNLTVGASDSYLDCSNAPPQASAACAQETLQIRLDRADYFVTEVAGARRVVHEDFEDRAPGSWSDALSGDVLTEEGPFIDPSPIYDLGSHPPITPDHSRAFDLAQINAIAYPAGFSPAPQPYDRAVIMETLPSPARDVRIQFELDTGHDVPVGTYMWVAEIGRDLSLTNMGPARILMMAGHNGTRHFRIRAWEAGNVVHSPWMQAPTGHETLSIHWGASATQRSNGFVRLTVGDQSIAVEGLNNQNWTAKWIGVGNLAHSYAVDSPSGQIFLKVDDLLFSAE